MSPAVTVTVVLTGDVQVNVQWDAASDVDLHVVEPSGEEIFYANDSSSTGGLLDLDSNPACAIDGVQNENIVWPSGAAPRGRYVVRVDYFAGCGVASTNYIVTVRRSGAAPQTFRGSFSGNGDSGGAGSREEIVAFTL